MGIEDILNKIEQDSRLEEEKILKEAEEKKEQILKEAGKESELLKNKILDSAEVNALREYRAIITRAHLEGKRLVLEEKRKVLEEIFQKAEQTLSQLNPKEYTQLMKKVLLNCIETGDEEIILPQKTCLDENFIHETNKELRESGKRGELSLCKERSAKIKDGFILRGKDFEINNSLSNILNHRRVELELKLSEILFKNNG